MRCVECGSFQVSVKDTRTSGSKRTVAGKEKSLVPVVVDKVWGFNNIWRKRQCANCGHKWSTVEVSIDKKGSRIVVEPNDFKKDTGDMT